MRFVFDDNQWASGRPPPPEWSGTGGSSTFDAVEEFPAVAKVFVSHSSEDRGFLQDGVFPCLREAGLDIWDFTENIRGSEQWERAILSALESCDWFVVAMSPSAARSPWVRSEVHWAMEHRWGRIVPLFVKDCNLLDFHLRMPELQYVDFRSVNDAATKKLREAFQAAQLSPHDRASRPADRIAASTQPGGNWVLWLEDHVRGHPLAAAFVASAIAFEPFETVSECCTGLLSRPTPRFLIVDQAVPLAPGVDFPPPYGGLLFIAWTQQRLPHLPDAMKPSVNELVSLIGPVTAPPALQNVPILLASQYRSPIVDALYQQALGSQPAWIDARANPDAVVRRVQLALSRTSRA